jgi:hypothetical protein
MHVVSCERFYVTVHMYSTCTAVAVHIHSIKQMQQVHSTVNYTACAYIPF